MSAKTAANGARQAVMTVLRPLVVALSLGGVSAGVLVLPFAAHADDAVPTVKDLGRIDAQIDMAKRQADLRTLQGKGSGSSSSSVGNQSAPVMGSSPASAAPAMGPQGRPATVYAAPPPPLARTPENEGLHLRAVFGVNPSVKAVVLLGDGSYQRVSQGDVVTGWRVVTIAPGAVVLTPQRVVKSTVGKGKSRKVVSKQATNGRLYVVKIDPPQAQMMNASGGGSGMLGARNSIFAEPLSSLPNPNLRNINQTVPAGAPLPRAGGTAPPSGVVGVGANPGGSTPPTSNLSNQTLPALEPSTDDTSSQPSSLNIQR